MKSKFIPFLFILISFLGCSQMNQESEAVSASQNLANQPLEKGGVEGKKEVPTVPFLTVLGIAQDAGFPQADCRKNCCKAVWAGDQESKMVSCLAVVDPQSKMAYVFDATPDFKWQWQRLRALGLDLELGGVFLTHAHVGHYTGLMHLGREIMGAKNIPVYAMPRMKSFLETNGPWSQLVKLNNIKITGLENNSTIQLQNEIKVTALQVPHRDEFSETVGYHIDTGDKKVLFIPDIDKWNLWDRDILAEIKKVDRAYLDGSFYQNGEIPNRDMSEIPHPFVVESMQLFKGLSPNEKAKIHFIHFNHTNPLLQVDSQAKKEVEEAGFTIAEEGEVFVLK